jgi:Tol biopolymer transport system component
MEFTPVRLAGLAAVAAALLLLGVLVALSSGPRPRPQPFPIAFSRADQVYVAAPDGSGAHRIYTPPAGFGTGGVRWSLDHSKIAVEISSEAEGRLVILAPDGDVVGSFNAAGTVWSAWAPDSSRLLVLQASVRGRFTIVDATAKPVGSIDLPEGLLVGFRGWVGAFDWSPNGARIALPACWAPCDQKRASGVFVVPVDGSGIRQVTDAAESDTWPTWSPDGRLAAIRDCFAAVAQCVPGVLEFGAEGQGRRWPGFDAFLGGDLAWSPDSQRIASVGGPPSEIANGLRHVRIGGANVTAVDIVSSGFRSLGQVEWSADGRTVLFTGVRDEAPAESSWSIWSIDVASGAMVELVADVEQFDADGRP